MSQTASDRTDGESESDPRYVVGIDLGTTNCAVSWLDTADPAAKVEPFPIEQFVDRGIVESRSTLPSFHYQWTDDERSSSPMLPWQHEVANHCTGVAAREAMARHPGRVVASAKSWLSHDGVDRTSDLLPWHGDPVVDRLSPVEISAAYLRHICDAWNHVHPRDPLHRQDVIITLPASFDEVARTLTVRAAKAAGLPRVFLIEEPQAAFYAWIDRQSEDWPSLVQPGQLILVCDIGGGTTDLTLIRVRPADNDRRLQFHRVAVGRHLILGGDNLDLAIAKLAESKMPGEATPDQWQRLVAAARGVKETMLAEQRPDQITIHAAAGGSRLIGDGIAVPLRSDEIDATLIDGFFPIVELKDAPEQKSSGFRDFGLPYAADPAITRHLAAFLAEHRGTGIEDGDATQQDRPDLILFNGGVLASSRLRDRIVDCVRHWFGDESQPWSPTVLQSPRLDLAVSRGAAYYGSVRRGDGVRIAANLGRSYYLQVRSDPPTAMCVIPGAAEAGQTFRCDEQTLSLQIGRPAQFPLWVSSTRLADSVGALLPIDPTEMTPLPPICTVLSDRKKRDAVSIDVRVESELSEIGTVGIFCVEVPKDSLTDDQTATGRRWKLEFDIRSTLQSDRQAHQAIGEAAGIVDSSVVEECRQAIAGVFGPDATEKPNRLIKTLRRIIDAPRDQWPPALLREMWTALMDLEDGRRRSASHESRWLGLVGFCLRPGFGVAADDWRVATTWRNVHGKLSFAAASSRTESMILWRRIAGGLTTGQQEQLAAPVLANLRSSHSKFADHEVSEVWRMAASLEQLAAEDKTTLIESATRWLTQPKRQSMADVLIWSMGRIGTRVPAYGPLNRVLPRDVAETTLTELLRYLDRHADRVTPSIARLALVQIARRTGDRFRDVGEGIRREVAARLTQWQTEEALVNLIVEGGELPSQQQSEFLGDSLPLGIRIAS